MTQRNALPEGIDHRDTGCDLSPSCLNCKLPRCQYDEPPVRLQEFESRAERWKRIWELKKQGIPKADIIRQLKISERTYHRAVKAGGVMTPDKRLSAFPDEEEGKPVEEIGNVYKRYKPARLLI